MKKTKKSLILFIALALFSILAYTATITYAEKTNTPTTPKEVLDRLTLGNQKFIDSTFNKSPIGKPIREDLYKNGQHPYVVVLTCADSRVVPEDIFYTGLGEMLVVRVAGNVVDDFALGTIEFSVDSLKTPLVVVMGHQNCGAVMAAKNTNIPGKLGVLVNAIVPSYEKAKALGGSETEILNHAIEFNINNSVNIIKENEVVKKYLEEKKIEVIGANYSLETGKVTWFKN